MTATMLVTPIAEMEIGNVRVRWRGTLAADPTTLRLRVDHLLGTADLQPPGMPPTTVLIVRCVSDPLPGGLAPDRQQARIDRPWEKAARSALTTLYQQAARPANGVVPDGADAVVFADEAELLACLALDICRGGAAMRWWWAGVRQLPPATGASVASLFRNRGDILPAIVHHLAALGALTSVINTLSPSQALSIVASVFKAYEMDVPLFDQLDMQSGAGEGDTADEDTDEQPLTLWERWHPAAGSTLAASRERACLIGLALSLYHSPAVIRSPAFQRRIRAWWIAAGTGEGARDGRSPTARIERDPDPPLHPDTHRSTASEPIGNSAMERPDGQVSAPMDSVEQHLTRSAGMFPASHPPSSTTADTRPHAVDSAAATTPIQRDMTEPDAEPVAGESRRDSPDSGRSSYDELDAELTVIESGGTKQVQAPDLARDDSRLVRTPDTDGDDSEAVGLTLEGGIPTRLGGIVYLINLMSRLDLPDCFEDDLALATTVGPWGTLELLARGLAGQAAGGLVDDPLWGALGRLAGRPVGVLPSLGTIGPKRLALPDGWIVPDDLVEEALDLDLTSPLLRGIDATTGRWLQLIVPYVRGYLSNVLRHDEVDGGDVAQTLLIQPGQVYISSTHVDVVLPLDAISISIRLAGLDRDPGWLPDFGRVVKLHFN
jgi:hypothetical protein